jgi:hypothetical protein
MNILRNLTHQERKTFGFHLAYSFIEGIILGLLALNEFVLIKSLNGTDMQIGFLFQFGSVLLLFSILFNEWIRRSANKAKVIRILAWVTRLPLLLLFFFPHSSLDPKSQQVFSGIFLLIFLLFYLANPIIYPIINLLLKGNYKHENFGPLYSYATGLNKLVMLGATFIFGIWLDADPFAFTYAYPVMALLGIASVYILLAIPYKLENEHYIAPRGLWRTIRESMINMGRIFKINKAYRDFETGFALYGFAWMTTVAVITIYFDKDLHLSYTSVAFYKNAYNLLSILFFPFFGKLILQRRILRRGYEDSGEQRTYNDLLMEGSIYENERIIPQSLPLDFPCRERRIYSRINEASVEQRKAGYSCGDRTDQKKNCTAFAEAYRTRF